jgi:hypothetical protein
VFLGVIDIFLVRNPPRKEPVAIAPILAPAERKCVLKPNVLKIDFVFSI